MQTFIFRKKLVLLLILVTIHFSSNAQKSINISTGFENEDFLKNGQKDIYSIKLSKGDFLEMVLLQKSVDVIIDSYKPNGTKLKSFDSPNGDSGPELIEFEALESGLYQLKVHQFDDRTGMTDSAYSAMMEENQGVYAITSVKILSAKEYQQQLEEQRIKNEKVIDWIEENAIPMKTVIAESGFDDLEVLKQTLKDVNYVGLGEATHGTREFFQMKHRMLEFLVKEMGFTVFAIEASYAGCKNINDYVLYGKGNAHNALASQGFWTWDTEEVIDMIEWMRDYNKTVDEEKKVKFKGVDIQMNLKGGGVDKIKNYLKKVDSIRFHEIGPSLDSIEVNARNGNNRERVIAKYNNFLSFFTMSKGIYIQRSSEYEYETVLEYCRVLGQLIDAYAMGWEDVRRQEREWRDYYMANNFFNMIADEKPETKVVLWAHNAHVSKNIKGTVNGGLMPLGGYLKEAYGDKYYAIGFAFNKGSFQAIEFDSLWNSLGLQEFKVSPAKENSLDWMLSQTDNEMYLLNLKQENLPEYIFEFLNKPLPTRDHGAGANRQEVDGLYSNVTPGNDYDGIIFINETHRSRPTATGMRKGQ